MVLSSSYLVSISITSYFLGHTLMVHEIDVINSIYIYILVQIIYSGRTTCRFIMGTFCSHKIHLEEKYSLKRKRTSIKFFLFFFLCFFIVQKVRFHHRRWHMYDVGVASMKILHWTNSEGSLSRISPALTCKLCFS